MSKLTLVQTIKNVNVNNFITEALGSKKGQFVSDIISLSESDVNLKECDPVALIKCAMTATALNLPLNKNLGYAYVIPYKNKKQGITVPQFQIGYKGLIQLSEVGNIKVSMLWK